MSVLKLVAISVVVIVTVFGAILLLTPWLDDFFISLLPRPQHPVERPYVVEEVSFQGGARDVVLAGELTMPEGDGPFPAVVLITGSGPQDRNEEIFGHKIFLVLSDYLTRRGFAVLRYDDRGVAESTGNFELATTEDFSRDAAAAMRWLRDQERINTNWIGFAGHSEGGYIAPIAAQLEQAAFLVLMMGPARGYVEIGVEQQIEFARAGGKTDDEVARVGMLSRQIMETVRDADTLEQARAVVAPIIAENKELFPDWFVGMKIEHLVTVWARWLANHDPAPPLKAFKGPVLALYGGKDTQVPAVGNASQMKKLLSNKQSRVTVIPDINHMFQPADTGLLDEYVWITTTIDERAMAEIADWMTDLTE